MARVVALACLAPIVAMVVLAARPFDAVRAVRVDAPADAVVSVGPDGPAHAGSPDGDETLFNLPRPAQAVRLAEGLSAESAAGVVDRDLDQDMGKDT